MVVGRLGDLWPYPSDPRAPIVDVMDRDRSGLDVLTRAQCLHLLSRARIGRLAFHSRAVPVILPVAFAVDEDAIVVRVADGSRLDAGTRDAVVAFEADGGDPSRRGWSVSVTGTTSDVSDPRELARNRALLPDWSDSSDGGGGRVVRISLELMSGRRGAEGPSALPHGAREADDEARR